MNKTIDTLVEDIYHLMSTKEIPVGVDLEEQIETFGENVKTLTRGLFKERQRSNTIRMSNIGKLPKYIWHVTHETEGEELLPHTLIKFMYGHLIEEMALFLTRAAGHSVTNEQKEVKVEGIVGHMDCFIDDVLVDVKSASPYGFKKFKDGTLAADDPFGYVKQIKGYGHGAGVTEFGWLAMDKTNGHLTLLKYDMNDKSSIYHELLNEDIVEHIKTLKESSESDEPPENCYDPIPDGKSGNMKLSINCSYCQFKEACYPSLRTFLYSTGPRYLTKVVNEPKVQELGHEFDS